MFMTSKQHLNHIFWKDDELNQIVRLKLVQIAKDAVLSTGVLTMDMVTDITLTGSLANYNWTKYSDIDLHIIVDTTKLDENKELVTQFFNHFKKSWNTEHNITIKGHEVEIYLQPMDEPHRSSGIFSLLHNSWIKIPKPFDTAHIDKKLIVSKYNHIRAIIRDYAHEFGFPGTDYSKLYKKLTVLKNKLMKYRKMGLLKHNEMSNENLVYKFLRNRGYVQLLFNMINKSYDKIFIDDTNASIFVEAKQESSNRYAWHRNLVGSTNKNQKPIADMYLRPGKNNRKVEALKRKQTGIYMLNQFDVDQIINQYNVTELSPTQPRYISNTGICIKYHPKLGVYYIEKENGTNFKPRVNKQKVGHLIKQA